jgi:hypothetical protein
LVSSPLPPGALLAKYVREGAYADCYVTDIAGAVSHAQYVEAFYTTAVFKLERLILKWAVSKPSTDGEARQLAAGTRPLEPGLPSSFGLFGLTSPLAIPVIASTDASGEANLPIPLGPGLVGGVTVGLQVFTQTSAGIRLSNPEQVFLVP